MADPRRTSSPPRRTNLGPGDAGSRSHDETGPPSSPASPPPGPGLWLVRYGVPLLLAVLGVIGIIVGHAKTTIAAAGVVFLGLALTVWLLNWLYRMSVESNRDLERDEAARDYFSEHGHWPDEGGT